MISAKMSWLILTTRHGTSQGDFTQPSLFPHVCMVGHHIHQQFSQIQSFSDNCCGGKADKGDGNIQVTFTRKILNMATAFVGVYC